MNRLALTSLLLLALPALAGELAVRDAWIRAAPPGAVVLAGYATLENTGDAAMRIVAVESNAFARAELHSMRSVDGIMRMRPLDAIEVGAGATVALAPGANHLMLREPKRTLAKGERVEIEFVDEDGTRTAAVFEVR
jgi:copper(I)-binding protein